MRLRYLAVAGPAEALDEIASGAPAGDRSMREIARERGFRLWADQRTPALVGRGSGNALIGLLIHRETSTRLLALPDPLPGDDALLRDHWGPYLLFRGDRGRRRVLRDPSGAVPLYMRRDGPLEWFSSDAALLLHGATPRADLHFLRHWLSFPFLRTRRTGIEGVQELLPGMGHDVGGAATASWSPQDHCRDTGLDFDEIVSRLRAELLAVIPQLVPAGARPVVQLSGGLDSSIVAAALSEAGTPFEALTFATLAADGDERRYARLLVERLGVKLTEIVETEDEVDFAALPALTPRPPENALRERFRQRLDQHVSSLGADLVLGGAGGDNLFAYSSNGAPAVDALLRRGPGAAARTVADIASLHGCTWWKAARSAARKAAPHARLPWPRDTSFLTRDALLDAPDAHPWLPGRAMLPGKADHVRSILGMQHFLDQDPAVPPRLHPLLSQPLLELCLSVPSWLWLKGGRDRAIAREAFRGLVPDPILGRRSKGRLQSLFVKGYMKGRVQIERLLVGGWLAELRLIDEAAARAYLRRPGEPTDRGYRRLLDMAAVETWLRSFGG